MRRRILSVIVLMVWLLNLAGCSNAGTSSTFSIVFLDVGQGDSALVECDGHYMLIDGGDVNAGNKVYNALEERGVQRLDILAISHMHSDHIGGLIKALTYASKIGVTISNTSDSDSALFRKLEYQLGINETKIKVPHEEDKYSLGSAEIEVVDVSAEEGNDSLVLLVTYGDTRFLFTGDIEDSAQTRISDKYENEFDEPFEIDLIKMPHHGSASPHSFNGTGALYRFIRTFKSTSKPQYAIISVGAGNMYGHPHRETLEALADADFEVYRTDLNGDITVKSDGKTITVETSK